MNRYRIFDPETDGLLEGVTRIHVLVIRDLGGKPLVFRHNDRENTIAAGIALQSEGLAQVNVAISRIDDLADDDDLSRAMAEAGARHRRSGFHLVSGPK